MRCIPPNKAPNVDVIEPQGASHMLTLSGAKAIAKSRGYETQERGGRLYLLRNGVEVGSTLISTYQPEGGELEISGCGRSGQAGE